MDRNHSSLNGDVNSNNLNGVESAEAVVNGESDDVDDESKSLLPPKEGGISEKPEKPRRKVQWLDRNGSSLAEIKEFEPSDMSDSDDEDSDPCMCRIM